ncbi:hypothetical protein ASD65_03435 [Microbacterium sp. Root61]|uniref:GNAT family N-acetyltransferase n=1 Tax=Microbacterium sp. Root61 TaxID=1736570 RepID=UPI0006FBD639|nr:GNAT family N-acetyltransferase [Microbacterium sp. Root61]KRA23581.1 hypothetical protein ASD65_03435 [Microbacterium sp. Root61]
MRDSVALGELLLSPIMVPDDAADPAADDFRAAVEVRNRVGAAVRGDDSIDVTPAQSLPHWKSADEEVHGWIVRSQDALAGRLMMYVPLEEGSRRVQIRVEILPDFQGQGFGRRVLAFAEDRARERGRSILQGWTDHVPSSGEPVVARTGFGAVPTDASSALLSHCGYDLEQVYRISTLDLDAPAEALRRMGEDAVRASTGYRYVSWTAPTPDEWIDDYAWMKSRMSTDAPAGDSVVDEEAWDAERVRRMESMTLTSGMATLVGAAQHAESGRLVAFTELVSMRVPGKPIDQNDTLVLSEHRGHRLGALVKTQTLLLAATAFPEGRRIVTGNAEENRPMLAINEAMGFTPTRYAGEWQKRID